MRFRISPVIGVMIMVCITVILAAGIAILLFGMSGTLEKTDTISGFVLEKRGDATGGGTILIVSTDPQGTHKLHVSSNTEFNKIQTRDGRIYTVKVVGLEVKEVTGPV